MDPRLGSLVEQVVHDRRLELLLLLFDVLDKKGHVRPRVREQLHGFVEDSRDESSELHGAQGRLVELVYFSHRDAELAHPFLSGREVGGRAGGRGQGGVRKQHTHWERVWVEPMSEWRQSHARTPERVESPSPVEVVVVAEPWVVLMHLNGLGQRVVEDIHIHL